MTARPCRRWTDDEDRVVTWAARRGVPRKLYAPHIGRTHRAVESRERRLGVPRLCSWRTWNAGIGVGVAS